MANVKVMFDFFDTVESLIQELSAHDNNKQDLLNSFFIRLLSVLDGEEGTSIDWRGIALVSRDDLPEAIQEINDEFLHDVWTHRSEGN